MSRTRRNRHPLPPGLPEMCVEAAEYHAGRCRDKAAYTTRERAVRVAKLVSKTEGRKFRVYLCPFCGAYHLTTKTQWKKGRGR